MSASATPQLRPKPVHWFVVHALAWALLIGLGSTPLRGSPAEEAVLGRPVGDITAEEMGRLAISSLDQIPADLQGSAAYRAKVGATMVARAWESATAEASNA